MIFVDLETTSLNPPPEGQVCEYALVPDWGNLHITGICSYDGLMDPGARAAHHLGPEDCLGSPRWGDVLDTHKVLLAEAIAVAHNASFDSQWFPPELGMKWICTLKLARVLWPDEESHSLQRLRYSRHVNSHPPEYLSAHRALYDTIVLRDLFEQRIEPEFGYDREAMITICSNPILLPKVTFGKHKGQKWDQVPTSYLRWIREQDFDMDVKHTVNYHLEQRRIP